MRAQGGKQVEQGKAFVPEILYQDKYYPICGHYFWDNDNGATTVCKLLGFASGKRAKSLVAFDVDSMPVGDCKPGQQLTQCTGGGNAWGKFDDRGGWCKKGKKVGVTVTCDKPGVLQMGHRELALALRGIVFGVTDSFRIFMGKL